MAIKAVSGANTQIKRIIVGVPVRNVIGANSLESLTDTRIDNLTDNQILLYDSDLGRWVNSSSLSPTGVTSGTYGSAVQIPQISVTSAGLIDSAKNISVATTLATAADNGTGQVSLLDSSLTIAGGSGITTSVSNNTLTVTLDSAINSGQFGNLSLSGNTLASTTGGQIIIDPNPVGDSGDVIVRGNLTVEGRTTTINSTVLSVNDKNIIIADSATSAAEADSAGIFIEGANASLFYNADDDRFEINKPLNIKNIVDSALFFQGVSILDAITVIDGGSY